MGKTKGRTHRRMKRVRGARKAKKSQKLKPIKIAALILSAIHDLSENKGSTPNKISGYISYASNLPEHKIKRQVNTALKRGVEYGVLRRYRGHYFLPTGDEMDRANRTALRFAHLPSSVPSKLLSNLNGSTATVIESAVDGNPSLSHKSTNPLANKKSKRAKAVPVSPSTSNISSNKDESLIDSDEE
ncbi:hypothetical protein PV325_007071 [Microctonus aethiopoides]|nr:hypothetical protein PV325_007071 [Microctonus aethiopoides]